MACTFQATVGGKFAPLIGLQDDDMDIDGMIITYKTAMTVAASEILEKRTCRFCRDFQQGLPVLALPQLEHLCYWQTVDWYNSAAYTKLSYMFFQSIRHNSF